MSERWQKPDVRCWWWNSECLDVFTILCPDQLQLRGRRQDKLGNWDQLLAVLIGLVIIHVFNKLNFFIITVFRFSNVSSFIASLCTFNIFVLFTGRIVIGPFWWCSDILLLIDEIIRRIKSNRDNDSDIYWISRMRWIRRESASGKLWYEKIKHYSHSAEAFMIIKRRIIKLFSFIHFVCHTWGFAVNLMYLGFGLLLFVDH